MARDELRCLGAALVNESEYRVEPLGLGEVGDEVHRDILKGALLYCRIESLQWGLRPMDVCLRLLASCAPFDVVFDELTESRPFIVFSHQFPRVSNPWMSSHGRVMYRL